MRIYYSGKGKSIGQLEAIAIPGERWRSYRVIMLEVVKSSQI